jgi:hypothetical protein
MALRSQQRAVAAQQRGFFDAEITPVVIPQKKGDPVTVSKDEHPRDTSLEALAKLKPIVRADGTITAGNASGVNDGACAAAARQRRGRARAQPDAACPRAGMAVAGVAPRIMGIGPAPASKKMLARLGLALTQLDVIELNEAFAAQGLAVLRELGVADDDPRVNPNGGAIALGHPLGRERRRLVTTAINQLHATGGRLCAVHDVHRRRPGDRPGGRAGLSVRGRRRGPRVTRSRLTRPGRITERARVDSGRRLPELERFPSGSVTQPNRPNSETSVFSSTLQPSSRRAASNASRSSTR